ncbi:hypothetical protein CYCD_21480 [Tenuifilaceae bacterium CYCD]|nr:hypothetical protein CYCD_21480 [Tenuifilaceae bacterium CYCD]
MKTKIESIDTITINNKQYSTLKLETMKITINAKVYNLLLVIYAIFIFITLLCKGDMLVAMALALASYSLALWVIVFADIIGNQIYNKTIWIMSMFFIPTVMIFVYPYIKRRNEKMHRQ